MISPANPANGSRATTLFVILTATLLVYVAADGAWWFVLPANRAVFQWFEFPLAAAAFAGLLWLVSSQRSPFSHVPTRAFAAGALLFFLTTRLFWVAFVPTQPVNDFQVLHDLAGTLSRGEPVGRIGSGHWAIFMYTWGYALILGGLYAIFGKAVLVAQLFNVGLGAATLASLYAWVRELLDDRIARVAAVLFLCWPTQMIFTNVVASEHVSLAAAVVALRLLSTAVGGRARRTGARHWTRLAVIGALLAVAYLTRFPLLVGLIAAVMTIAIARGFSRQFAADAGALLAGFVLLNFLYVGILATVYEVRLPGRSIAGNLLVGVNPASDGAWNAEDHARLVAFPTFDAANAWAMEESLRRIRSAPAATTRLIVKKAALYWATDTYAVWWGIEASVQGGAALPYFRPVYHAVALFHLGILILAAAGAVWFAVFHEHRTAFNLILLPILGSTALHSVLEVQTRYHYPFEPLLFVLAALAFRRRGTPAHCEPPSAPPHEDVDETGALRADLKSR